MEMTYKEVNAIRSALIATLSDKDRLTQIGLSHLEEYMKSALSKLDADTEQHEVNILDD